MLCCDDFVRRDPFLYPLLKGKVKVALRVLGRIGRAVLPESIGARPILTVLHARNHIKTQKRICTPKPHGGYNGIVVVDRVDRRDSRTRQQTLVTSKTLAEAAIKAGYPAEVSTWIGKNSAKHRSTA